MVAFESEGRLFFEDNGGTVAVRRAKLGDQVNTDLNVTIIITITINITIAITIAITNNMKSTKNINNTIPGSLGLCGNSVLGER